MSLTRPLQAAAAASRTSSFLPPLRASSSKLPRPRATGNRYLIIRDFFTKQAALTPAIPSSPLRASRSSSSTLTLLRTRRTQRFNSSSPPPKEPCPNCPASQSSNSPPPPSVPPKVSYPPGTPGHAQDYTPFIRRLISQSTLLKPNSPHRPTKEQLLEAATSWWERLRIRIKWFTIRGWRRFNTDDLSAFASWFVLGNSTSLL